MNKGPVLIIDDDDDDKEFLQNAWNELEYDNPLIFFGSGEDALHYLKTEKVIPFLVLCDVNLPKMNGFELKEKLLEDTPLNHKSIPFVFWSNFASKTQIEKAYNLGVNGFFIKENTFDLIKQSLIEIVAYWLKSKVPE